MDSTSWWKECPKTCGCVLTPTNSSNHLFPNILLNGILLLHLSIPWQFGFLYSQYAFVCMFCFMSMRWAQSVGECVHEHLQSYVHVEMSMLVLYLRVWHLCSHRCENMQISHYELLIFTTIFPFLFPIKATAVHRKALKCFFLTKTFS